MRHSHEQGYSIFPKETIKNLHPLTQLVLAGKKPGAIIDQRGLIDNNNQYRLYVYRELGLEAIPSSNGLAIAIGKFNNASVILRQKKLPEIPQVQNEITQLANNIKDKTIAQAIIFLYEYPRINLNDSWQIQEVINPMTNQKFKAKTRVVGRTMEKPEVAALEGVLFGYENCCIKYYMNTRYFGVPRDEVSEEIQDIKEPDNPCVLCPQCVKKL